MSTIKASIKEYKNLQELAKRESVRTGEDIPVKLSYSGTISMVTAPTEFLHNMGF